MDLAILFGVALVVFGPKRLPELGKSLGQGIGNFKKAVTDAQEEVSTAVKAEPKAATSHPVDDKGSEKQPEKAAASTGQEPPGS